MPHGQTIFFSCGLVFHGIEPDIHSNFACFSFLYQLLFMENGGVMPGT